MWFGEKELSKFSPLKLTCWLFYAENAISIMINQSNQAKVASNNLEVAYWQSIHQQEFEPGTAER